MTKGLFAPGLTDRPTGMSSLAEPRVTYVVTFLCFAIGIGHVLISGEAKSHIYSPVTSKNGEKGQNCNIDVIYPRPLGTCATNPKIIVYNRIGKAGSSTMLSLIKPLAKKNNFTLINFGEFFNHSVALKHISDAMARKTLTLICSHQRFPSVLYGEEIAYINLLRKPEDQVTSSYYYSRYGHRPEDKKDQALRKLGDQDINECVHFEEPMRRKCLGGISKVQSLYFCGNGDLGCDKIEDAELIGSRAIAVMQQLYVVGVLEHLSDFLETLQFKFPNFFRGITELYDGQQVRVSGTLAQYASPNVTTLDYLIKETAVDQLLYQKADAQRRHQNLQIEFCKNNAESTVKDPHYSRRR